MKETWQTRLDEHVDGRRDSLIAVRRHLHQYPEASGEEIRTTAFLADRLSEAGFEVLTCPGAHGLIVNGGAPGEPRIAIRGDIDALRIQEAEGKECRSLIDGIMHACGHDAHAAIVLGAAVALREAEAEGILPEAVRWRAIFQPAEETNLGALEMMVRGALDGVGAALAMHMDPARPTGTIGLKPGVLTADCDEVIVEIEGRGGHAARPHEALDPIAAAAQFINGVYFFATRRIGAQDPAVVTFGHIRGGENSNVIPDVVKLKGTVRCLGQDVREMMLEEIRQVARGISEASGARIDVRFIHGPPAVHNDPLLTQTVRLAAVDLLGSANVQPVTRPSMGGEDFSNYLRDVPGCMMRLGCAKEGVPAAPLHSAAFDPDEESILIGAKLLARAVVAWCLENPRL